jgi:hypothetical protein
MMSRGEKTLVFLGALILGIPAGYLVSYWKDAKDFAWRFRAERESKRVKHELERGGYLGLGTRRVH